MAILWGSRITHSVREQLDHPAERKPISLDPGITLNPDITALFITIIQALDWWRIESDSCWLDATILPICLLKCLFCDLKGKKKIRQIGYGSQKKKIHTFLCPHPYVHPCASCIDIFVFSLSVLLCIEDPSQENMWLFTSFRSGVFIVTFSHLSLHSTLVTSVFLQVSGRFFSHHCLSGPLLSR